MRKFTNWLSGPFPKWGTLLYITLQAGLAMAAFEKGEEKIWNVYMILLAVSVALVFIKSVYRIWKHGRRNFLYQEARK